MPAARNSKFIRVENGRMGPQMRERRGEGGSADRARGRGAKARAGTPKNSPRRSKKRRGPNVVSISDHRVARSRNSGWRRQVPGPVDAAGPAGGYGRGRGGAA